MDVPPLIQEGTIEKENILEVTDCIENLNEVEWYFLKTGKSGKSNTHGVLISGLPTGLSLSLRLLEPFFGNLLLEHGGLPCVPSCCNTFF